MDCEQAANLISARIDGELAGGDDGALDAHLAGCATCRATMDAAALQDAAMVRAFAGGRDAAAMLAMRVAREMSASSPPIADSNVAWPLRETRWFAWTAFAAAAVIAVVLFLRPTPPSAPPSSVAQAPAPARPADSIAHLSLACGEVFTCPSGQDAWKPIAPGDGVAPGTKIRTANAAKCELALPDGSRVRLNAATELRLAAPDDVQLSGGQIFSAIGPNAGPLRIAAGSANVVTTGGPAAQLDVARATAGDAATVTVVAGAAQVHRQGAAGQQTTVRGGEFLRVGTSTGDIAPGGGPKWGCEPLTDPLKATRWLDDLLLLLPADNEELLTRVDLLLSRIVAERAARASPVDANPADATPGPIEHDVRARGQSWAPPIARYVAASTDTDRAKRRTAARLLADLAPPSCVEDLIPLLADDDPEIRFHTAAALNRLTGQTLGFSPDACAASPRDPTPLAAWQEWWNRNRSRYPARGG